MLRSYRIRNTSQKLFKRRIQIFGLVILYVFGSLVIRRFLKTQSEDLASKKKEDHGTILRKLLSIRTIVSSINGTISNETISRCIRPSIEEFPRDYFTQTQRRYGAVLLHVFCALYMFVALAFVCDDYFISALDKICERLELSEDVAGATFMAAGSSAPELFTAIIGVFIAKGDVGVGTIVGSAVFNILVIIALCSLFAGQVVQLSWWPLCRDSLYYVFAIGALILTIHDGYVSWYESMVMIIMYFGYILIMKLNPMIINRINSRRQLKEAVAEREIAATSETKFPNDEDKFSVKYVDGGKSPESAAEQSLETIEMTERSRMTWKELGLMIMLTDKFSPTTRFRAACLIVIHRESRKKVLQRTEAEKIEEVEEKTGSPPDGSTEDATEVEDEGMMGTPFLYPDRSPIRIILWLLSLPIVILMYFTIPDCRKSRWEKWYLATFFFSIFWIMVFSYIMVWMVCVIGFTIGIPDVIMGITFLAAGTSIPDAISSLIVAREGMGDMAVSNSIGSNIFDILIGLAVPWFLKTAIINPGKQVQIQSGGMVYSVTLLFGSVVLTVFIIHRNNWRLDRKLGVLFTIIYLIFITLSACIEFNVFKDVNFPTCPYSED